MSAVASSSSNPFSSPLDFLAPGFHPSFGFTQPIQHDQLQYNDKGRMLPFVETPAQKRERMAFMRKREKSRRVSAWLAEATQHRSQTVSSPLEDRGDDPATPRRPEPIAEEDESESYMVYTPSPFTADNVRAHTSSALLVAQRPRRVFTGSSSSSIASSTASSPSRHSSRGSLSSISEEEEELESP
ncbi:hypothetical protein NLI96_g12700 [Meripilus lineatus]|uniref:Uncharacterized protein n=1 Tax=Meripilus lineatus TaxID=2056292 RepID=A0AAD5UQQ9_9APHY|nr:hypothetical protein NLI96_g12700 [Physisporinus lineatus]